MRAKVGKQPEAISFAQALESTKRILDSNKDLAEKNLTQTEAEQLFMGFYERTLGKPLSRLELYTRIREALPSTGMVIELERLAHERALGRPLQYLLGFQTFLEHQYEVGPGVLIPRPETELLLSAAISELSRFRDRPMLGIEVGLGSGILSVSLLAQFPELKMVASEFTQEAAKYARRNAERILGSAQVQQNRLRICFASHSREVFEPFLAQTMAGFQVDFLISNPPYLVLDPPGYGESDGEVEVQVAQYEPKEALFAPPEDPLYFYRKFAVEASQLLKPEGFMFLEIPHQRSGQILELFRRHEWETKVFQDFNQRDRVLFVRQVLSNGGV